MRQSILRVHSGWAVLECTVLYALEKYRHTHVMYWGCIFLKGTTEKMYFTHAKFGNYAANVMFFVFAKHLCVLW